MVGVIILDEIMNKILLEDLKNFDIPTDLKLNLSGSTIVVTGATGLIGSLLIKCLAHLDLGFKFILPIRNKKKAENCFNGYDCVEIEQCDIPTFFNRLTVDVDYIFQCASPTNGAYISEHPSETLLLPIESMKSISEYARTHSVKSIVYLSSIEYYGENHDDRLIDENFIGDIDLRSPRSAYPLGKRAAEFLSFSYAKEYDIPIKIARLTQTFGAGISNEDNRVFAQFARSIIGNRDIILHTQGNSAKPYCYTTDSISALLYILIKGKDGEAYNVATPETYISIKDMANFMRDNFNHNINVTIDVGKDYGYAPETRLNLNSDKLLQLGWSPKYGLKQMYERLIKSLNS